MFIVIGLTRLGFEPTIYSTQGEHGNHYTTGEENILLQLEATICHWYKNNIGINRKTIVEI